MMLTTRATTLPGDTFSEKLSRTVTSGLEGYANVTFSNSSSPLTMAGFRPALPKGSILELLSTRANNFAAAEAALVKSTEYGARVVKFVAATITHSNTLYSQQLFASISCHPYVKIVPGLSISPLAYILIPCQKASP